MGQYSIKELEQLSGIKAHTIRMWEKRHKIIEPSRTSTNIRYYSDLDLKKIINVSLLNTYGLKISKIADMSLDDMNKKVLELSELHNSKDIHIDQMVVTMIDMEEELFEKILNHLILRFGFEKTITEIVYPFLEKIGILWQTQNITPAHEHFISNLIRQKIIVAVDSLPLPAKTADKILIFLPEGELHELGLLFYHYLIRKAGFRTYYLGQNVPHEDLVSVYKVHQPVLMITSITSTPSIPLESIFERFENDFGRTKILVSGYQVQKFNGLVPHNVQIFSTALELNQYLQ
jgi:MerR family transcriptional regulator, light-induced transcriptional regulator